MKGPGERSYVGLGPKGYTRPERRVRDEVCERLMLHPDVDATEMEVAAFDGHVTLSGGARNLRQKILAEKVTCDVPGVGKITNRLVVSAHFTGVGVTLRRDIW